MFARETRVPERVQLPLQLEMAPRGRFMLMPAWDQRYFGIKIVASFPDNRPRGKCDLTATYLLFSVDDGRCLAMIDGDELTTLRTVATSALAARKLARPEARTLLVLGTGRVSSLVPLCFRHVASLSEVRIWSRNPQKAEQQARAFRQEGLDASAETQLHAGVEWADVISTATPSPQPLIEGRYVRPGTHVDLIGSFTAEMREADDDLLARATLFVDTAAAYEESGELIHAAACGALRPGAPIVDLRALFCGDHPGRRSPGEITVFKSVGFALEDFVTAVVLYEGARAEMENASPSMPVSATGSE